MHDKPVTAPPPRAAVADNAFRNPLPRLTSKVFTDLAVWMMGLGLLMGIVFPFFVQALGVPSKYVLTPAFFTATIAAGLAVGAANQFLSRAVVRSRLRYMGSKMTQVETNLRRSIHADDAGACTPENCSISIDSDDELGEAAASFNLLVEALAASHKSNEIARRFATTLSSHIELDSLVEAALRELQAAGDYSAAGLCVMQDGDFMTVASNGIADPDALAIGEMVQRSFRTLDTVSYELPDDLRVDAGLVAFRPRSVTAYPLHIRLVPIGVVVLASTAPTTEEDTQLIQHLLPNFSVALNNALSHERLQRVAAIDPLTGLFNRRFGLERLSQDFSRSVRSKEPLGLVMFDIDHFKAVNDTYGHQAGDEVLKTVATAVSSVLREGDTLLRYGGEEFMAVLPGAGENDVRGLGERIRRVVESSVVTELSAEIRVTVSLGAAAFPSIDVDDMDDLIRRADHAMYAAKNAGRNRLAFADA